MAQGFVISPLPSPAAIGALIESEKEVKKWITIEDHRDLEGLKESPATCTGTPALGIDWTLCLLSKSVQLSNKSASKLLKETIGFQKKLSPYSNSTRDGP